MFLQNILKTLLSVNFFFKFHVFVFMSYPEKQSSYEKKPCAMKTTIDQGYIEQGWASCFYSMVKIIKLIREIPICYRNNITFFFCSELNIQFKRFLFIIELYNIEHDLTLMQNIFLSVNSAF